MLARLEKTEIRWISAVFVPIPIETELSGLSGEFLPKKNDKTIIDFVLYVHLDNFTVPECGRHRILQQQQKYRRNSRWNLSPKMQ